MRRVHRSLVTITAALTTLIGGLISLPADAGPSGGTVVGAIIQGAGVQPNSPAIAPKSPGGVPTQLLGTQLANGRAVNGDGIQIPHPVTNTAGLLATTNLRAGKYNFNIPGLPNAAIVNQGANTAASGGFAALVAPGVRNAGTITATLGTVSPAAGSAFTLDFYGDRLITLAVSNQIASRAIDVATGKSLKSLIANDRTISVNGGRVALTAAAARAAVNSVVKNTGVVEAESIGRRNGMIVLGAATAAGKPADAPVQTVNLAGKDKGTKGGTVNSVYATGALNDLGTASSGSFLLAGLIGSNVGTVSNAPATQTVSGLLGGSGRVGGPVGVGGPIGGNLGAVTQSATGAVSRLGTALGGSSFVSGLVGGNAGGVVAQSYAAGSSLVGGLIGNVVPALTNVVGGVGLVNGNALTGLLATTLMQTGNLLGTLGNTVSDVTDLAATQVVAPLTDTLGSQAQIQSQLNDPLRLASLTQSDVVNTGALNRPSPPPDGPGTAPGGLPPQFGSRFFVLPPLGETRFIEDEAVLHIPASVSPAQIQVLMSRTGLNILGSQRLGLLGVTSYRVRIGNGSSVASVIRALAASQIVAGAQPNYTYRLAQERAQNPELAGATHEGDAAQYALGKLGVIGIHHQLKGTNVAVAVIDSQIDVRHPDLDGVIADQFDAVGQAEPPHPHGTGTAGAIAAHHRLMGIAPGVRLYAIHAFSRGAASAESTTFNVLKGLDWAAGKGVRVINMSFAGPRDPSMERALKVAHDKGIVLIAAAGNAGPKSPPLYPGADPSVIAVTATDANDKLFSRANRGRYIAVAAPGVDILLPAPENGYQVISGTSVASAEVSGVAALLLERNPNLKPEDIREILTSTATHLAGKDRDDDYGSGLVDPSKAIQTAGDLTSVGIAGALPRPEADPKGSR
jgi:subtilisin family serine protease